MLFNFKIDKETDLKSLLLKNNFSLRTINKLLRDGKGVNINGNIYNGNYKLNVGDVVSVNINDNKTSIKPIDKEINIIYENEYFSVVNKPTKLAVIPSIRHYEDNLAGRVLNYYNKAHKEIGIHVVNRLDYLTSGLVIFAKSTHVHNVFSKIEIEKKYKCHVIGVLKEKTGVINAKIDRIKENDVKRHVCNDGKDAITLYQVIEEKDGNSYIDIKLKTGRTHQIRVHFSYVGHPLVGDDLYGNGIGDFDLCSYYLSFVFPLDNKKYEFELKK